MENSAVSELNGFNRWRGVILGRQKIVGTIMITPLRKRNLEGKLYTRVPHIQNSLIALSSLSRDELVSRASITERTDPSYIPSECLLYFVRAAGRDGAVSSHLFEQLYKTLAARVLRALPRPDRSGGKFESSASREVRDNAFGHFVELLASDRVEYAERLDYFEVRFDGALASLRKDASKQTRNFDDKHVPLDLGAGTGELAVEVEEAIGDFDPFVDPESDADFYRLQLHAAIKALPPEQARIIEMLRLGFPIDSKEPDVLTIASALGRSEKTIRTYRDKAFLALKAILTEGDLS